MTFRDNLKARIERAIGGTVAVLTNDLAALEALATTGLAARTAASTWATRTLTAPAAGITVSNGDGVSGNPTLVLANDLAAAEGLSGTGTIERTASDTWGTYTTTTAAKTVLDDTTVLAMLTTLGAADVLENTDGWLSIDHTAGFTHTGTWTPTYDIGTDTLLLTRTPHAGTRTRMIPIPSIRARTTASKGIKLTAIEANYRVDVADLDNVLIRLIRVTQGADGAAPTGTILGGNGDDQYDSAHDTAAKRGDDTSAPELHKIVMTIPGGSQAYMADGVTYWLAIVVDGDAGGVGTFVMTHLGARYSETLVESA